MVNPGKPGDRRNVFRFSAGFPAAPCFIAEENKSERVTGREPDENWKTFRLSRGFPREPDEYWKTFRLSRGFRPGVFPGFSVPGFSRGFPLDGNWKTFRLSPVFDGGLDKGSRNGRINFI